MRTLRFVKLHFSRTMLGLLPALLASGPSVAAESMPYEARIVTPGAPVHSGPGQDFYPTDTLAQGDVVEVYREQPGGWLGIRPPESSFSWIFGRHLKLIDGGLAEIDNDDVPSRIGSRLGERRSAVQVRLKRGEVVEILSKESLDGETWYKIAPPSGEFRWIHARNVTGRAALAPSEETEPAETPVPVATPLVTVPMTDETVHADANITLAANAQPEGERDSRQNWRASQVASSAAPETKPAPAAGSVATETLPPATIVESTPPTNRTIALPRAPAGGVHDGVSRQLTDLELRLSRIVAEPPANWQIAPLRQEAQQLLAQAGAAPERAAITSTIAKLDRFAGIAQRYQQVASTVAQPGQSPITPIAAPSNAVGPDGQRYDAIGILRPVVSKRPGAPQFALVDERGQVVSFVTPTPDMNLQPFLGHRIGITGSRGFIPEFQRAHVTAGRVSPLAERMLR